LEIFIDDENQEFLLNIRKLYKKYSGNIEGQVTRKEEFANNPAIKQYIEVLRLVKQFDESKEENERVRVIDEITTIRDKMIAEGRYDKNLIECIYFWIKALQIVLQTDNSDLDTPLESSAI